MILSALPPSGGEHNPLITMEIMDRTEFPTKSAGRHGDFDDMREVALVGPCCPFASASPRPPPFHYSIRGKSIAFLHSPPY
jgi:hypothetical protein